MSEPANLRLLRIGDVCDKVGLGKTTMYAMVAKGTFPAPRQIGQQAVAWIEGEVDAWILGLPRAAAGAAQAAAAEA